MAAVGEQGLCPSAFLGWAVPVNRLPRGSGTVYDDCGRIAL